MAELVNMAGEGLPLYLWSKLAEEGQDPWDVGQERARREEGGFSYRNTIVLEKEKRVIGMLTGYPISKEPQPIEGMPPMFVPLQELENLAPLTWYVNVLAVVPEERGQGHGTTLLSLAVDIARRLRMSGLSLIVSSANENARRLYERHGYTLAGSRPMVKEDWQHGGTSWELLRKAI